MSPTEITLLLALIAKAVPAALAGTLSTKVVPLVIEETVAPAGMPVPVTTMPGRSPTVLATVTSAEPMVVTPPVMATVASVDIVGEVATTKLRRGTDSVCVTPPEARMPPEDTVSVLSPEAPRSRAEVSVIASPRRVRSTVMSSAPKAASTRRTSVAAESPMEVAPEAV